MEGQEEEEEEERQEDGKSPLNQRNLEIGQAGLEKSCEPLME